MTKYIVNTGSLFLSKDGVTSVHTHGDEVEVPDEHVENLLEAEAIVTVADAKKKSETSDESSETQQAAAQPDEADAPPVAGRRPRAPRE